MEALGALASVATLVVLIGPTAKFVKSLNSIASDNGVIAKEIRRMSSRIQTSAYGIDIALKELKGHCEALKRTKNTPSEVLQFIIDNNFMDFIVSGTNDISKQMSDTARDLKDMKERPKIIKKLKWCLRDKMEVESLFPEMQLVAVSLTLVCPIIRLEIDRYLLERSTGDAAQCIKEEMKYLRSRMKLCEQQYQRIINEKNSDISFGSSVDAEFQTLAEPLLRLSRSVRRTGAVPGSTGHSSSGSQESSPRIKSRPSIHTRNNSGDRGPPSEPLRVPSREPLAPRDPRSVPMTQGGSSEAPRKPAPASTREISAKKPHLIPSTISQRIDATSNSRLKAMRTEHSGGLRSTIVHVENPNDHGSKSVVILTIDSASPDNYISTNTAERLGLKITELEPGHARRAHHINGKTHGIIVGQVSGVKWSHEGLPEPIILDFFVKRYVQDEGKYLILGKKFVQAVERYGHNL